MVAVNVRYAAEVGEELMVVAREGQRYEPRPRLDDLEAELLRQAITEVGRAPVRS